MAVAFDVQSGGLFAASVSTKTFAAGSTFTIGSGSNRAVVFAIMCGSTTANRTVSAVTWDSGTSNQSATFITGAIQAANSGGSFIHVELWGLVAPASGNKALKVDLSASAQDLWVAGVAYTGVDQTGGATSFPHGTAATGTGTTGTVTVTSATGNAVVACWNTLQIISAVNNTQVFLDNASGSATAGAANRAAGAATVSMTMTQTSALWAGVGTDVAASTGGTNKTLDATTAGSYSLSGTAAGVEHGRKVTAAAGSYALTGTDATLRINIPIAAAAGSYSLTGTAAGVEHGWKVAASAGSYALTGTAASLRHAWVIPAGAGSYSLSGTDATLRINRPIVAGAGSYSLTGTDASLVAGSNKVLAADAGSYSLTGTSAGVLHGWKVPAGAGSYALSGTDATLSITKLLTAAGGSYSLTGTDASLLWNKMLPAEAGTYLISGTDVILTIAEASTPQVSGGSFGKPYPDRGKRRYWRAEDHYTPEQLQAEIAAIEVHLERARLAKQRTQRAESAALAKAKLEEIAIDGIVADVVEDVAPEVLTKKPDTAAIARVAARLKQVIRDRELEEDDEDVLMLAMQ